MFFHRSENIQIHSYHGNIRKVGQDTGAGATNLADEGGGGARSGHLDQLSHDIRDTLNKVCLMCVLTHVFTHKHHLCQPHGFSQS